MNCVDKNGSNGGDLLSSAQGAQTGKKYTCVEVLEDDTTFSVFTNTSMGGKAITARTWKRGDRIWGPTTALTVTAGEVIAWNRI